MLRLIRLVVLLTILMASFGASARDSRNTFPIAQAMAQPEAAEVTNGTVKFYWGSQAHPKVEQSFGKFTSNKKTNAFNKSDKQACDWAFLSAVKSLRDRAVREGGNAVINIRSIYRGGNLSSETEYECGAGALMAGVSFEGEVVKLAE